MDSGLLELIFFCLGRFPSSLRVTLVLCEKWVIRLILIEDARKGINRFVKKRRFLIVLLTPWAQAERIQVQGPGVGIDLSRSYARHEVDEVMVIVQRILGVSLTGKKINVARNGRD